MSPKTNDAETAHRISRAEQQREAIERNKVVREEAKREGGR